jgi:putative ABC transport system permease protein
LLSVTSGVTAILLAQVLPPLVPISVEIPSASYVALLVTAVVVGMLGSIAGLRRALAVDPALAFGG